jgi:uncharacterized protein
MMENGKIIFYLAIPSADLDKSAEFYAGLGCRIARRYNDRVTVEFLGHQVVCHLSPEKIDPHPEMYPRHFGITFTDEQHFERILSLAMQHKMEFFQDPFIRFSGLPEEHRAFFLQDPSNNLLEFKYYRNAEMAY